MHLCLLRAVLQVVSFHATQEMALAFSCEALRTPFDRVRSEPWKTAIHLALRRSMMSLSKIADPTKVISTHKNEPLILVHPRSVWVLSNCLCDVGQSRMAACESRSTVQADLVKGENKI